MSFRLSKWYLDCVTADGDALIAYVAELRWARFALRYTSVLEPGEGRTHSRSTVRGYRAPSPDGGVVGGIIRWSSAPLGVSGTWRAVAPPMAETLLASERGLVRWDCVQPAAAAELRVANAAGPRAFEGLGYVERLTLTIPPWLLPIDELHWGRYVAPANASGEHDSVVWIDWRGRHGARRVFRKGRPVDATEIDSRRIVLGDGSVLALDACRTLRAGALGATVLSALPLLARSLPGRMLGVEERKWCSRAELTSRDGLSTRGWAIHEVVRWP